MWKYLFFCFTTSLIIKNEASNESMVDVCTLQADEGTCKKKLERFYYNAKHNICSYFQYSGCGGNPNNFKTKKECRDYCPGRYIETQKPLYCLNAPYKGECKKSQARYYYDPKTNTCYGFMSGECAGDNNRFSTADECHNACRIREFSLQINSV